MLNSITIMGRLTRPAELRQTNSGKSVCSFAIAVDRDFKGANGEKEVDFIDVVAWGNTAEFVARYLDKGRMAIVKGRLQIREWTDKEGNKRRNAEVIAENIYFGDSRKEEKPTQQEQDRNFDQLERDVGKFAEIDPSDGELPF